MEPVRSQAPRSIKARLATSTFVLLAVAPLALSGAAPALAGALERAKETGTLRIGYRADARPISFRDDKGAAAGYAIDLCLRVVEAVKGELGLSTLAVEWVPVTTESRFSAVQQGQVDLVCGPDTATLARRKEVSFSIPIFPGGIGALVRADAPERLTTILSGKQPPFQPTWRANAGQYLVSQRFAVVGGTTADNWTLGKGAELELPFRIVKVNSYDAGAKLLLDGDAEVFFGDRALLLDAAGRSGSGKDLRLLDRHFTFEPVALMMARGDEDFRLAVDRALSWMYNNGKAAELFTKWGGKPDESLLAFYKTVALPE